MKKPQQIAVLTDEEIEILRRGRDDPDIITDYFFRPKGASHGWRFDYNFDPEGAWQKTVHHASQKRIIVIGGFGSGKTRGVAISACVWAMTMPDFAFLNVGPVSWQSELMYKFIMSISRGTPFARLIYASPKRPYPTIELRFIVRGVEVTSTLEFMSVDKNANQVLSWEGDWINIEEAGLLDDLGGTITNLGSRLRGSINGRDRLGRMSMISNSWDNPELWYRFDLAASLPEDYLSLTVSTRHNRNVTPDQLRVMLKDIPEDEHERFIDAARPEGKGIYFNRQAIYACEDQEYGNFVYSHAQEGAPGYLISTLQGAGVVHFSTPRAPGHSYMILGDPGISDAPNRNAPAILVWDVTDFPAYRANLVACWWGSGHGSITPFVRHLIQFMADYDPIYTGVDATGPQKNSNEMLNSYLLGGRVEPGKIQEWIGIDVSGITNLSIGGLDFSGGKKPAYLIAGRLLLEARLFLWPKFFSGLRSQLSNYDPDKDRSTVGPKIPQDLVAAFCMSAYAIRVWFAFDPRRQSFEAVNPVDRYYDFGTGRDTRLPVEARDLRDAARAYTDPRYTLGPRTDVQPQPSAIPPTK